MSKIPHRLYLTEDQMPQKWFNLRSAMAEQPDPLLHPGTLRPLGVDDLSPIFCEELARQELDGATAYVDIPEPIQNVYKMYRPSPLIRAYELEKALDTPARIYYKFEGNNTSGSHKLNSAVAQAYYAKMQGLTGVTTETGAGQWGTALSEACSYFGLTCDVFMVKCSCEQKPFRKAVMNVFDASITPSPSPTTEVGRQILRDHPETTGSLGCAISEAVESAVQSSGAKRYVLGSVLNQVLLHQSIIGLESKLAMEQLGEYPDVVVGCAGGGSNLGGLMARAFAQPLGIPAYIYDAVTSDEMVPEARVTGFKEVMRTSFCHVLNARATSHKYAETLGRRYEDMNLVVAHLGGGISISAHRHGRIIDSVSDDAGPFSPDRSGSLNMLYVVDLCYSGKYTKKDMLKKLRGEGGMSALLGTHDCREIERRIQEGDEWAALVYQAQALQIAKGVGIMLGCFTELIDAVILTGGLANSKKLTGMVIDYLHNLVKVVVIPGENEMEALALGGLRILDGQEQAHIFRPACSLMS